MRKLTAVSNQDTGRSHRVQVVKGCHDSRRAASVPVHASHIGQSRGQDVEWKVKARLSEIFLQGCFGVLGVVALIGWSFPLLLIIFVSMESDVFSNVALIFSSFG